MEWLEANWFSAIIVIFIGMIGNYIREASIQLREINNRIQKIHSQEKENSRLLHYLVKIGTYSQSRGFLQQRDIEEIVPKEFWE